MEAELTKMDVLPTVSMETLDKWPAGKILSQAKVHDHPSLSTTSGAFPPSPSSPPSPSIQNPDEFNSCGAFVLSQKLRNLELQARETETSEMKSALDPSCLLTPPNTPHSTDPADLLKAYHDKRMKGDSETLPWSSDVDAHDEGTV